jgi:hypothetical protein
MGKNKEKEFKEFMVSQRKSIGPGFTNAPVWEIQKKGERIWNRKQKRTWKNIDIGKKYKKKKLKEKKAKKKR